MSQYVTDIRYIKKKSYGTWAILTLLTSGHMPYKVMKCLDIKSSTYKSRMATARKTYGAKTNYQLVSMATKAGILELSDE